MENAKKFVPLCLLATTICRILVVGPQLADALIVLGLSGLVYLLDNLKYNKDSIQVQQEINNLREEVRKYAKENAEVKQYVSGVKMATALSVKK